MKKIIAILAATLMVPILLGACGAERAQPSPKSMITPVQRYAEPEDKYANPGSIFSEAGPSLLFEDSRARRVGDIILVKIVENTKAKHKADTTADRESTVDIGVGAAFGRGSVSPFLYGGPLKGKVGEDPIVSASTATGHSATGETKRENYVTTTVGARVVDVLPNGVLQIQGAREIQVNDETEYLVVSGLVRTSDVLSDNSVLSSQLAESNIAYYGKGVLADKQKPGWLSRLLDFIWPF